MDEAGNRIYDHNPKPTPLSRYHREIEKYVDYVSSFDDVLAIYSMGSVTCPGISDIDLIVVTKDIVHNAHKLSAGHKRYDHELFIHDVIVISRRSFKRLQYIFFASNLKLIWANSKMEQFVVDNAPERERALSLLLDFTEARLLEYNSLNQLRRVNIRKWLTRIDSLRHTVNLAAIVIGDGVKADYAKTLGKLTELRSSWLKNEQLDLDLFANLMHETAAGFESMLNYLADIPEFSASLPPDRHRIVVHNKMIRFAKGISYRAEIKNIVLPANKKRQYLLVELPYFYLIHLAGYFDKEFTGCYLNSLASVKANLPNSSYVRFQAKRLRAIYDHWAFLKKNSIAYSMAGYICFTPRYNLPRSIKLLDFMSMRMLAMLNS